MADNNFYNFFVTKIGNIFPYLHNYTFVGADGSTSSIDSYSALVFIINLLLNKNKLMKPIFTIIPLLILLSTFRLTPGVALLFGLLYLILPIHLRKVYIYSLIIFGFTSWIWPYFFRENTEVTFILNTATHARATIWTLYIDEILKSPIKNIVFGMRGEIPIIQLGSGIFAQPHSSFLRLFLTFGGAMYLLFFAFIFHLVKKIINDKEYVTILLTIIIFSVTNNDIIYNVNIVYIITIMFLLTSIRPPINQVILQNPSILIGDE